MSQVLTAVDSQSTVEPVAYSITVAVDREGNIEVDKPFVQVPVDSSAVITWTVLSELPDVFFDTPGITMFGEGAPMVTRSATGSSQTVEFFNIEASKQHRSFFYRIHLLQQVGSAFFPLHEDPIIHNDPPPAP